MYKDWKAICQVPDTHFMWALALLDTSTDFGRQVVERFPEYFTQEEQAGPVPLSVLRQDANRGATEDDGPNQRYDDLVSDGACDRFDIPTQGFSGPEDYRSGRSSLPPELAHLVGVKGIGFVAEWGDKKVVVVENGMPEYIFVAPAERIALDR